MKTKALVLAFCFFLGAKLLAVELKVYAAASLTEAMEEIKRTYEKESGDTLRFNFGASSLLARQIELGAPADLFFSADEAKMDALESKGLLLAGSRRALLSNMLVVVVAKDAKAVAKTISDLTRPEFKKIALGEPETVPAGIYAREHLQKLGLWDALKEKVVPTESVRAALAAVESGNVEAGFVYKTDSLISKKVRIALEIPPSEGPRISYPMAVLESSKQRDRAKKLGDYLGGPAAQKIFEGLGFIVPPPPSS